MGQLVQDRERHAAMQLRGQWQTDEQLAAIGNVVVESANLELIVEQMLGDFIGAKPEICDILIGTQMLDRKIELLSRIAPLKPRSKRVKKELAALIERADKLNKLRKIAVHGTWAPRGKVSLSMLLLSRPPPLQPSDAATRRNPKSVLTAERLRDLGTDIQKAHQDLWRFWIRRRVSLAQMCAKRRRTAGEGG